MFYIRAEVKASTRGAKERLDVPEKPFKTEGVSVVF